MGLSSRGLGSHVYLPGDSPYKRRHFPGDGDNHLVGFPSADQLAIPLAQPHLGLPADILDRFRERFKRNCRWRLTLAGYR